MPCVCRFQVEVTPDWLRKFTAGACWVRGLSSGVEVLRKFPRTHQQAEQSLELLLNQRLFARHKRGQWYEQLALLYQHNLKDNVKVSMDVCKLKDTADLGIKFEFCFMGRKIWKIKIIKGFFFNSYQ